ncbi:aspartic peptidase domain-containing protein [Mariannaea sp. PMI_226]|nr:aspartic peptidase domain-containing protein [Mariannaea sp. PMI_226]
MRPVQLFFALAASAISTGAIALQKRNVQHEPRVVSLDLQRKNILDPVRHDRLRRRKRSGSIDVGVDNEVTLYFFNASLGTPKQHFRLHLDTGSSDLWVNTKESELCSTSSNVCSDSGTYSANKSSTYEYVGSYFNISYTDGSGAAGDYVTDNFHVGNTTIKDLQFGIGYESTSTESVLGIGYPINEVQVGRSGKETYDNLPAKMVAEGLIASNAYSLFLNDLDANEGTILFGGVDHSQYHGNLVTLPIQQNEGQFSEFFITLTGLALGNRRIGGSMALAVLLDTGSSLTYLPTSITDALFRQVGAVYNEKDGVAFVPCSLGSKPGNMTFKFSDPAEIVVPISELVLDFLQITGRQLSFDDGTPACMFGIAPASSTNVLGDTFLRSAYVVFDLDNNEISLAQSNFNATKPHITEIAKGKNPVPSATESNNAIAAKSGKMSAIFGMIMTAYIEVAASWLFKNYRGRDDKAFFTLPAFSQHPEPTLAVRSPDCGPDGATLGSEYMFGGEGRLPQLEWDSAPGVEQWLLVSEDPDAPLPTPICHGIYLGIPPEKLSVVNDDFKPVEGESSTKLAGGFWYGMSRNGKIYIPPRPLMNHGIHRYWFEVIGLNKPLDADFIASKPSRDAVGAAIEGRVVVWGRWMGQCERKWQ